MEKKKIALFDIDNTIYEGYIFFPLVDYLSKHKGNKIDRKYLDELYKDLKLYEAGKVDYETTIMHWLRCLAKSLGGVSYDLVLGQTESFFEKGRNKFFPYLKPVITILQKTHDIYFVTGEPEFVAWIVAKLFRVTGFISSEFEVKKGIFTGRVKKFLAKRKEKLMVIRELLEKHDIRNSFAFGDSEADIEMLNSVEHAVCVNPKEGLRKIANAKGWIIAKPNEVERMLKQKMEQ